MVKGNFGVIKGTRDKGIPSKFLSRKLMAFIFHLP